MKSVKPMNAKLSPPRKPIDPVSKFVSGAMGLIFVGIGLTTLVFLWGMPFGEFGSPPLFFRVFGSFIALSFVIMGGAAFIGMIKGVTATGNSPTSIYENEDPDDDQPDDSRPNAPPAYTCPKCGAPLAEGAEVSPHGDVKCGYCSVWFNIHGK
jgi:hypothetical protein